MKTFQAAANAVVSGPMPEKGHEGHQHHHHGIREEDRRFSFANAQPLKVIENSQFPYHTFLRAGETLRSQWINIGPVGIT